MIPSLGGRPDETVQGRTSARTVLIVDEAVPVVNSLVEALQKAGIRREDVRWAPGPQEAIQAFRKLTPHVVFSELVGTKPEDGLEVILEMLDAAPDLKIVLMTAEPRDSPEVRAAIRAGVFALIEKPLRHDKIRSVLQDLESEEGGIERFR